MLIFDLKSQLGDIFHKFEFHSILQTDFEFLQKANHQTSPSINLVHQVHIKQQKFHKL